MGTATDRAWLRTLSTWPHSMPIHLIETTLSVGFLSVLAMVGHILVRTR